MKVTVRVIQHDSKDRIVLDEPVHLKHFALASASLHCIKHHLKKAASQSTWSTHHQDRLSYVELCSIRVEAGPAARGGNDRPPQGGRKPRIPQQSNPCQQRPKQVTP